MNHNGSHGVVKHWMEIHPERKNQPKYSYHQIGMHKSALERQNWEALYIEKEDCQITMNSKSEFGRNFIPKLIVDPEEREFEPRTQDTQNKRNSQGFSKEN